MNPDKYISTYGGKAGGIFFLRDFGGFEKNLLPIKFYLDGNQGFDEIRGSLPKHFENMIVRASHPNDYWGLVDVLDTVKNVGTLDELEEKIMQIRTAANSRDVLEYNRYENQSYDGKIRIFGQPQLGGSRGSMIEHPHKRGTYLIDIVSPYVGDFSYIERVVIDEKEINIDHVHYSRLPESEDLMRKIVNLYEDVKNTGFIPDVYSFQMEFGFPDEGAIDRVFFYQARPFKKFEKSLFNLDGYDTFDNRQISYCLGITPQTGLVLPVITSFCSVDVNTIDYPFALVLSNLTYRQKPDFRPKNMIAFLPIGNRVDTLEHNTYKWMQKAKVSITSPYEQCTLEKFRTGDKINISSDGIHYKIKKIDE